MNLFPEERGGIKETNSKETMGQRRLYFSVWLRRLGWHANESIGAWINSDMEITIEGDPFHFSSERRAISWVCFKEGPSLCTAIPVPSAPLVSLKPGDTFILLPASGQMRGPSCCLAQLWLASVLHCSWVLWGHSCCLGLTLSRFSLIRCTAANPEILFPD